jgi:peptide/nickel transport system substrate-binding protein
MGKATTGLRAATLVGVGALLLTACGGSGGGDDNTAAAGDAQQGGTLRILSQGTQILSLDPQRNYTGEDLAFANGFLTRTLTAYQYKTGSEGWNIEPDLATDTGTSNEDATEWSFTLRDGVTWQTADPVTCEDVKYGVSRTFAQTVITGGPTYAISMLDIPKDKDGNSVYKGPYETKNNNVAAFDEAVTCSDDNKTITFKMSRPVPDFNSAVTLSAFSPVPKDADTGEKYQDNIVSTGPYQIQEYKKNQQLVLERNPNWDAASDPSRPAYPDEIIMEFGLDGNTIDQRLIASQGDDTTAISNSDLQSTVLNQVFNDPQYEDRRFNEPDPYTSYIAIDTLQVPNVKHRLALAVCLDRAARRTIAGGDFAGDLADGVIKNNFIGYEPTGMWDGALGETIPAEGNVEYGKQLLAEAGEPMPKIRYDYSQSPTADKSAASLVESEKRCGIEVEANPIDSGQFYGIVLDPAKRGALISGGWGADWGNASTVVPELLASFGGWNLSDWSNKEFDKGVEEALVTLDPVEQQGQWNALNAQAMTEAPVIPTLFGNLQRMVGTDIGGEFIWAPYGSWNYGTIYINQ